MSFQFRDGEGAAEGARRIVRAQIDLAVGRLEAGASGEVDRGEVVHEVRKRIKKARAVLRLARGPIGKGRVSKADRGLRDAVRPLGEARDASALVATLDDLAAGIEDPEAIGAFEAARIALIARRDEVSRRVLDEQDGAARAAASLRAVGRRIARWDLKYDRSDPVSGLKRAYKLGRAALGDASGAPTPEALHEWRKRVKDLGYQLRALVDDPAGPAARLRRLAGLLAEELGEMHDLDVLRAALPEPAAGAILPRIEHRLHDLRHVAFRRGGEIYREKPRALLRGLRHAARPAEAVRGG